MLGLGLGRDARRLAGGALALLLLLPLLGIPAQAETWPQRPVKFIVTLGAGSGVDFGTRLR
jgi:tripartite-type tricarboxylate transporter receptor subunit TctC